MSHRASRTAPGPARMLRLGGLLAALLLASAIVDRPAHAQPAGIGSLSTATSLSNGDRGRIADYGAYWTNALADGSDPDRALDRLVDPVRGNAASNAFRNEYADAVIDPLAGVVRDAENPQAVTAALVVLSQVGTPGALRRLGDFADVRNEERDIVRQVASHAAARLLDSGKLAPLDARTMVAAARNLRRAAGGETRHDVLLRQLQAMIAADDDDLPAEARGEIFAFLGEAVTDTAPRIDPKDGRPLGAASSVISALVLQTMIAETDRDVQEAIGRAMCPAYLRVLEAYATHWDDLRTSPEAVAGHAAEIERIENAMNRMLPLAYPGRTARGELAESWRDGDRDAWRRAITSWTAALR